MGSRPRPGRTPGLTRSREAAAGSPLLLPYDAHPALHWSGVVEQDGKCLSLSLLR